jgi:hypothetical protein
MMIPDTIGSQAQMDLVDIRRKVAIKYKGILHYVDHHSDIAHFACLKKKRAETVGQEMERILSTAAIPEVLQSDNGDEFLGDFVRMIRKHFGTVQSEYYLEPELLKDAKSEYEISAINEVLYIASEKNPTAQVNLTHLHEFVIDANVIYNDETAILIAQRGQKLTTSILMQKCSYKIVSKIMLR